MIKLFQRWKTEGHESLHTPEYEKVTFKLSYKKLLVGELKLKDGVWSYQYSDDFKNQNEIKPIPDFPSINKIYESKELYPFFLHRIPSIKQPKVQEKIKKNNLDETNEVDLLRLFGLRSISNPFLLKT